MTSDKRTIGTLQERSLHAAIKAWYQQPGDSVEQRVDGYYIDIQRAGLLIEIQTRNFAAIKTKLHRLVERHAMRLVYPIAAEKWIVRMPVQGDTVISRRRSPKHGRLEDLFSELVRIPALIQHANFSVEVLLIRAEEILRDDGQGSWRRKGWSISDRRLLQVLKTTTFQNTADFRALLPPGLPPSFTARELSAALQIAPACGQKMAYCLRHMQILHSAGKSGRSTLYTPT